MCTTHARWLWDLDRCSTAIIRRNDDLSAPGGEWILTLIRALLDLRGAQAPSAVTGAYYNKRPESATLQHVFDSDEWVHASAR